MTLPYVTVGWSAVRNCGISRSYPLFALFVANNTISSRKKLGLFSYVSKKIISINTAATFQEVGGVTEPFTFCRWHKIFHSIALTRVPQCYAGCVKFCIYNNIYQ